FHPGWSKYLYWQKEIRINYELDLNTFPLSRFLEINCGASPTVRL
ncbi:unnamed protein product, partial [marine sediment metagenome]